jgi:transposase-like protein
VAVGRSFHEMDFVLKNVTGQAIKNKLQGHLSEDCVLCTDGQKSYNLLCEDQNILHKVLSGHQVIDKTCHINTVNAYHSRLKNGHRRFNSTATKYLANYLGWFRALEGHKHEKIEYF